MNTIDAIKTRRSIRKFLDKKIPNDTLESLLDLAIKAPSAKNRQPWRYYVLQNKSKSKLADIMLGTVEIRKAQGLDTGSCMISINAIRQASAVLLIFNPYSKKEADYNHHRLLSDTQSIGASIQTLLLAAKSLDLGTLWICDVFYAQSEISAWLKNTDELVAAVALGYPDQAPYPRPRKPVSEVTEWLY